jgi:hypothetical protein
MAEVSLRKNQNSFQHSSTCRILSCPGIATEATPDLTGGGEDGIANTAGLESLSIDKTEGSGQVHRY